MGLEKLTDDNLSSLLCNPENIPLLERIALRELKKYHELQDRIPGYNPLTHDTDITPNKKELQALFEETISETERIISVNFPAGTEKVEIIGTFVIPEFGTIAMMILVVSIVSLIVLSSKSALINRI